MDIVHNTAFQLFISLVRNRFFLNYNLFTERSFGRQSIQQLDQQTKIEIMNSPKKYAKQCFHFNFKIYIVMEMDRQTDIKS